MGQDLYRWDDGGVLKHHCPICQTPLSHDKCRTTCLGKHVEWCHRYHSLFRVNWASRCNACKTCDEQHEKRHRDIAEIVHRIKKLEVEEEAASISGMPRGTPKTPRTPLTVKALNNIEDLSPPPSSTPKVTRKEKKAAKKVAKAQEREKVVTTADIERIAQILHPEPEKEAEKADADAEAQSDAEDEAIKRNLKFNYSTCNTKSDRHDFIENDRVQQYQVLDGEVRAILEQLEVDVEAVGKAGELVVELSKAIKSDLQSFHDELYSTARTKAGFWRWANKKHYRVLKDRGKEWDDKHKPFEKNEPDTMGERRDSAAEVEADANENASSTSSRRGSVDVPSLSNSAATVHSVPTSLKTPQSHESLPTLGTPVQQVNSAPDQDSGWTQVGKKLLKPRPKGKVTLAGNGGLRHLQTKPKGKFTALAWTTSSSNDE